MSLTKLLTAKLTELKLSPTAAAEKAGVAYPSFVAVVNGKSLPNARTFKKYAKLLGVSAQDVEKMVLEAKGSQPKRGKAAAGKVQGARRGRPPGSKNRTAASGRNGLVASLQAAVRLAGEAESVLGDQLAMSVHRLPKAQRRLIESVLGGLR